MTAGGLHRHAHTWVSPTHPTFLVPGRALSRVFRAKFRDGLRTAGLFEHVPREVWRKEWVVHLQHAGTGEKVLEYLARYVFRIALVNSRLERFDAGHVTFRYRDGRSGARRRCTLDALQFLGRFLQHVLPQGFAKVRHYGLFSPRHRPLLEHARTALLAPAPSLEPGATPEIIPTDSAPNREPGLPSTARCPQCRVGLLRIVETLAPQRPPP